MKFIKFLGGLIVILAIVGYGIYYFGTNFASEKLMDVVSNEIENSGEMEEIKSTIENDPELKSFIEEAESADKSKMPFTTKEEATKVLIKKVGVSKLNDIRTKVQDGDVTKEEVLQEIQDKLTEEEILALKVIAYKEIYGK